MDPIDQNLDENQHVELALITQNLAFLDDILANTTKFKQINDENIEKMLTFVFQKLTLQRGLQMI